MLDAKKYDERNSMSVISFWNINVNTYVKCPRHGRWLLQWCAVSTDSTADACMSSLARTIGTQPQPQCSTWCVRSDSGDCDISGTSCACLRAGWYVVPWWPSLWMAPSTQRAAFSWTARQSHSRTLRRLRSGAPLGTLWWTDCHRRTILLTYLCYHWALWA